MTTVIANKQRKIKAAELNPYKQICTKAVQAVLSSSYIDELLQAYIDNLIVYVTFVGGSRIKSLNKMHRDINKVTDVLSFPMLDMINGKLVQKLNATDIYIREDGKEDIILGDIVVNFDRVFEQSEQIGHSADREMFFLVVHSTLHLVGYDHVDDQDEECMLIAQREIMRNYKE